MGIDKILNQALEHEENKELPYEENEESFGKWFRKEAKEKWENYLNGNEKGITIEERDTMRRFLVKSGTREEIQTKLDSFGFNLGAYEVLLEEIKTKRPDIVLDDEY
jgi:hypothetical protein